MKVFSGLWIHTPVYILFWKDSNCCGVVPEDVLQVLLVFLFSVCLAITSARPHAIQNEYRAWNSKTKARRLWDLPSRTPNRPRIYGAKKEKQNSCSCRSQWLELSLSMGDLCLSSGFKATAPALIQSQTPQPWHPASPQSPLRATSPTARQVLPQPQSMESPPLFISVKRHFTFLIKPLSPSLAL